MQSIEEKTTEDHGIGFLGLPSGCPTNLAMSIVTFPRSHIAAGLLVLRNSSLSSSCIKARLSRISFRKRLRWLKKVVKLTSEAATAATACTSVSGFTGEH
jgi:hypothetical protein